MSNSIVITPYAKNAAEFTIARDGILEWRTYTSIEEAIKEAFAPYAWPGGNPIAYRVYSEYDRTLSEYMCSDCIQMMYRDNNHSDSEDVIAGRVSAEILEPSMCSGGIMCENCNEYIIEPFCVECSRDVSDALFYHPAFYSEQGQILCSYCLGKLVVNTKGDKSAFVYGMQHDETAVKVGKNEYKVRGTWYVSGEDTFRAYPKG